MLKPLLAQKALTCVRRKKVHYAPAVCFKVSVLMLRSLIHFLILLLCTLKDNGPSFMSVRGAQLTQHHLLERPLPQRTFLAPLVVAVWLTTLFSPLASYPFPEFFQLKVSCYLIILQVAAIKRCAPLLPLGTEIFSLHFWKIKCSVFKLRINSLLNRMLKRCFVSAVSKCKD